MADHNELGAMGEDLAVHYLRQKGCLILSRNYRFKHLEADIIATCDSQLLIVEVKTRQSRFMAGPEKTVTKRKQKALIKVANAYSHDHQWDGEIRFDIVSILVEGKTPEIEHLKDAFYPTL